jgi:DNA polymerase I-like protein with 3'-5' exonuclease and polymerase domains
MNVAIDFESTYSKDLSVTVQGVWHYARETDIYMVSMYSDCGMAYVGSPANAPWSLVKGANWVMHNAAFDLSLVEALLERKVIPKVYPREVYDTADLSAYLGFPRSLAEAAKYLLGIEISKATRDNMKGKSWESMSTEFKMEVAEYALLDSKLTLELYLKHGHKMPRHEWDVSRMTREMGMRGVPVNLGKLQAAQDALLDEVENNKKLLPWVGASHLPPLSIQAVKDQCAAVGIWAPTSFAEKDAESQKWEDEFGDIYPWVNGVRAFRKANKHLKAIETMISRTRPDGRMGYDLKFFGASTGRDSGSGGWNAQNLPKAEIAGVEIRKLIEAPKGKTLIVADLAQIESRVISFLAEDEASLDIMRSGMDVYEAHARATMGYTDPRPLKEVDNKLRQLAKARVLGLGFGCGAEKFQVVAKMMAGLDISPEDSERIVREYRESNPKIIALWGDLDANIKRNYDRDMKLGLPSGRWLTSWKCAREGRNSSCMIPRNGTLMRSKIYGGLLAENVTQATARDIFMHQCRAIEGAGYEIILRVHDEVVVLVDEENAEHHRKEIVRLMTITPDWCEGLPLDAEATITPVYCK